MIFMKIWYTAVHKENKNYLEQFHKQIFIYLKENKK